MDLDRMVTEIRKLMKWHAEVKAAGGVVNPAPVADPSIAHADEIVQSLAALNDRLDQMQTQINDMAAHISTPTTIIPEHIVQTTA